MKGEIEKRRQSFIAQCEREAAAATASEEKVVIEKRKQSYIAQCARERRAAEQAVPGITSVTEV